MIDIDLLVERYIIDANIYSGNKTPMSRVEALSE